MKTKALVVPVALLALCCGACLGRLSPENDGGRAVQAMAYSSTDAGALLPGDDGAARLAVPTPENLFSVIMVTDEVTVMPLPEHTAAAPTTASAAIPPPAAAASPAPPPAFAIQVVETQEGAPRRRRVLIYHTHTYEAYEKQPDATYQETEPWRTANEDHNVVKVGETLAGLLRGLGFEVEHDKTAFEPPELSAAYARSLDMLEKRVAAGERYDLYIDLHRDAYAAGSGASNTVFVGDTELARLMLLVGKGEGQTGQGFTERPDWEANLAVAQTITEGLNAQAEGLCKPVMLKSGRYNQHVAVGCVLIEVGNNRNTLAQALAAMPYLADAIDGALEGA